MGKNKGKGGKNKRKGKNQTETKRELLFKEDGQAYAQVIKPYGNGRFEVLVDDEKRRIAHVRGAMIKKVWIMVGDIILVGLRGDTKDDKCDIIHRYEPDEVRNLKAYGELNKIFSVDDLDHAKEDEDGPIWESKPEDQDTKKDGDDDDKDEDEDEGDE